LAAAKVGSAGRRIVVLFQPHRFSRTQDLMEEFARSFNNADALFVTDIYAASEDPIDGINSQVLTEAIKRYGHKNAHYIGRLEDAGPIILNHVSEGDLVITLGAGPVHRAGDHLLALMRNRKEAPGKAQPVN
jgi:UDP-N-acetylmuramate--alanine ligase